MSLSRSASHNGLFQIDLPKLAKKLLQHVAYGELVEADALLKANPELSLMTSTALDYSGHEIVSNALRAALGSLNPDMWKMIITHIKSYKGNAADNAIRAEFLAQFPGGVEKPEFGNQGQVVINADLYDFSDIVKAINEASDNEIADFLEHADDATYQSRLSEPFAKFRKYFSPGTIESGLHFNTQNLRNAFNIYNRFGREYGMTLNTELQQKIFFRMVIGYLERFIPAHYAHAFCQGLGGLVEQYDENKRSLQFEYNNGDNNVCYYPLDQNPRAKLGYQVASDYCGGIPKGECIHMGGGDSDTPWMMQLEVFDLQNRNALWELSKSLGLDNRYSCGNIMRRVMNSVFGN